VYTPIGRPIINTQLYVLDGQRQPLPVGIAGELFVGGTGVGRGYLNDPERTCDVFVPDPFSPQPGARLYKTGDLCRWRPDGTLEFLGRIDHQVKLRGFRIELGEIESVLGQHPAVREVVVLAREDPPGDKRLVAYLAAREAPLPGPSELRSHLQTKLPEYMIPTVFVELGAMPLSPNGKVDRKALPAPDLQRPEQEQSFVPPRNRAEEVLARIWAEVLRLDQVGMRDNFFALGGDSILAIQVISKAQREGLGLSVRQLFLHQTIAALASVAVAITSSGAEQGPITGPVVLTPIQRWFFDQQPIDPHHFNQAVLLEVRERLDSIALERAVKHLVQHHDALRLRFVREGAAVRQINAGADETVTVATADLSAIPAAEQAQAIEKVAAEMQGSLCLEKGALMRVAVLDLGPERPGRLLVIIHHLVVDGVSWRILLGLPTPLTSHRAAAREPSRRVFRGPTGSRRPQHGCVLRDAVPSSDRWRAQGERRWSTPEPSDFAIGCLHTRRRCTPCHGRCGPRLTGGTRLVRSRGTR
jgi:aryl carrier-like protein